MKIRLASPLQKDSIVDGLGIRTVIWTQGCAHGCPGCHNPGTHDFDGGALFELEEIKKTIDTLENQDGITFSGGDPVYQIEPVIDLAEYARKRNLTVWLYSGFEYEEILKMPLGKKLLKSIDVLVDGKFILEKRTLEAPFRGSSNQRIIDTQKSLKENKVILLEELMRKRTINKLYEKDEDVYI